MCKFSFCKVKSQKSGMGEMKWPDGRKYKGIYLKVSILSPARCLLMPFWHRQVDLFLQDKRHGHGCFVWSETSGPWSLLCSHFLEGNVEMYFWLLVG